MDKLTFDDILAKIRATTNFSLQRWGDGEWGSVMGASGSNCDGHKYFPEMSLALKLCLLDKQRGYMGMQPLAIEKMGQEIATWCKENKCMVEWCNADVLHEASIADRIGEFVTALQKRKVIFVGSPRLSQIATQLHAAHIIVPLSNVWKWRSTIVSDIQEQIAYFGEDVVILYSMSMPTNTVIRQIEMEYGNKVTQISCGSVWDCYCGYQTRRYHQEIIDRIKEEQP